MPTDARAWLAEQECAPRVVWLSQFPLQHGWERLFEPWELGAVNVARQARGFIRTPPGREGGAIFGGIARGQMAFITEGCADFKRSARSCDRVLRTVHALEDELHSDVLVLGSLTTSVTDSGRMVAEYVDRQGWDTIVTTGDAGSAAVIYGLMDDLLGDGRDAVVGIVGLGIIGTALLRMLAARRQRRVLVVGTNAERLRCAVSGIDVGETEVATTSELRRISEAHLVVTVTSSDRAILSPPHFSRPTVIIDPAVPSNVRADPGWRAGGHVVYTAAGQLQVGDSLGTPSWRWGGREGTCYACLCEGAALAALMALDPAVARRHFVGAVEPDLVRWFNGWRRVVGWSHAPLRMFDEPVGLEAGREILDERRRLGTSEGRMSTEAVLLGE
jgi:predicted amino acid dehydrogenase